MKHYLILTILLIGGYLFGENLWQMAVSSYPDKYIDGEGSCYESVYYEGVLEETSTYNLTVIDNSYLRLDSGKINGEKIAKKDFREIQDRINFQFVTHSFDPFDPTAQEFLTYIRIGENNGLVEYQFTFNNGEDNIIGSTFIQENGVPYSSNFTLTSLPIESEEFLLRELYVEYFYKEGTSTPWVLYNVIEKVVLDLFYTFFRIPLSVETSYIFYRT